MKASDMPQSQKEDIFRQIIEKMGKDRVEMLIKSKGIKDPEELIDYVLETQSESTTEQSSSVWFWLFVFMAILMVVFGGLKGVVGLAQCIILCVLIPIVFRLIGGICCLLYRVVTAVWSIMSRPTMVIWNMLNVIGLLLAIWAGSSFNVIDSTKTLFEQPHWWLLILIWVTNPRALAILYIINSNLPIAHWKWNLVIGGLFVPGAWGLFMLSGSSVALAWRYALGFLGFVIRDVLEYSLLGKQISATKERSE